MMTTIFKFLSLLPLFLSALLFPLAQAILPKRGLAANDDIPISQFTGTWQGEASNINWQYNWDSTTSQAQAWAEYIPMLWGLTSDHTTPWLSHATFWLNHGSGHLLAFNEPENSGQSGLSVRDAVLGYWQYMQPFADYAALGAPAVSNDGLRWLQDFMNACQGCKIDFVPVHWYNDWTLFADLQNWIGEVCRVANGRPVWLTEFQAFGSIDQQSAFLEQAIPWLDSNPCVYRYAYFGAADPNTSLLENGGPSLSSMGLQYAFTPFGYADTS